jgi:hypothetical protein
MQKDERLRHHSPHQLAFINGQIEMYITGVITFFKDKRNISLEKQHEILEHVKNTANFMIEGYSKQIK